MAIPADATELERFTPPSLANLPIPPVFLLRPADGREQRRFEYRLLAEGLSFHDQDAIRAEIIRGLAQTYSGDGEEHGRALLTNYWTTIDQGALVEEADAAVAGELVTRIVRGWPPLARMLADNRRFNDEIGRIAASMFIVGWSGIDVAYSREDNAVPLGRIDDVEEKLGILEGEAGKDNVEGVGKPGTAWASLTMACYMKMMLPKAAEKNSSSPPSSQPAPSGSTPKRSSKTAARSSKASASSKSRTASSAKSRSSAASRS